MNDCTAGYPFPSVLDPLPWPWPMSLCAPEYLITSLSCPALPYPILDRVSFSALFFSSSSSPPRYFVPFGSTTQTQASQVNSTQRRTARQAASKHSTPPIPNDHPSPSNIGRSSERERGRVSIFRAANPQALPPRAVNLRTLQQLNIQSLPAHLLSSLTYFTLHPVLYSSSPSQAKPIQSCSSLWLSLAVVVVVVAAFSPFFQLHLQLPAARHSFCFVPSHPGIPQSQRQLYCSRIPAWIRLPWSHPIVPSKLSKDKTESTFSHPALSS
ncbi:hypothetical protein BKA61DRAFT_350117 [Leptodontidium sp. MPI-SDFR-AT-0119]|nr:hypothetical protein BKA61DRAFT_350117 [Leptodontidium sp. MPI-SDFR-AT-0119]